MRKQEAGAGTAIRDKSSRSRRVIGRMHKMTIRRRQFLFLSGAIAALVRASRLARAQPADRIYPNRPVRLIIGYPPGGSADLTARLMAQWLQERLGQTFVVESRPGAATNLATEAVVRAPADGDTLLLIAPANAINATLYDKLNFNFFQDIAPVAGIIRLPNVVVVNPSASEDDPGTHCLRQSEPWPA